MTLSLAASLISINHLAAEEIAGLCVRVRYRVYKSPLLDLAFWFFSDAPLQHSAVHKPDCTMTVIFLHPQQLMCFY
jgi:hypothetical protein